MTELQKAIEWLEETKKASIIQEGVFYITKPPTSYFAVTADNCRILLDALKWIPVSERLPTEELASVLVYTKDGGVSEGQYYPTIKSWKQFRWSVENATVTHWMPLPNPPESEARATPVSGDSPIAVRCQSCGCPVVFHRLFEDGVLAGEHIDCACGYVDGWGKEV